METPLMYAVRYCMEAPEIVDLLIEKGSDKNMKDKNGLTALHKACHYNNHLIIQKIVTEKNINIESINKLTPLMIAIKNGHYESAIALLSISEYNIDVNISD
eukprot:jgi/Orpsp1_1/1178333/evm.model.c7180000064901.1